MITLEHTEILATESGILPEVLALANVRSCSAEMTFKYTGLSKAGIAFPYYDQHENFIQLRLRKDCVEEGEGRYHQKKGSRLEPYFIKENISYIYDPSVTLVITEGEKKLLSFYSHFIHLKETSMAVVSASGCYGFFKRDESGSLVLSDGFDTIPFEKRDVFIIPDSDYFINLEVKRAYDKLCKLLIEKSATVHLIDLRTDDEEKIGLDDFIVKYGENALKAKMVAPAISLTPETIEGFFKEAKEENLEEGSEKNLVGAEKSQLPELTGYMKVLYDWILETSPIKQPILTYGSVIAVIGTVLSNLYRFYNAHPVFYIMFVSRSGSGKDRPLKVPKVIFSVDELKDYIGLAGYRSDASIIDLLPKQRSRLDLLDEVDGVLKISKSDNGYQSGIVNILTEIWSENNKYYPGRRTKTDGVFGNCWNPCLNIVSALTPTAFRENFTKSMMLTGFGGRFLYFIANDSFEYTENFVGTDMNDVPDSVLAPLKHWHSLKKYDEEKKRFYIQNLGVNAEAKELLEKVRKEYFDKAMSLDEEDPLSPIAQRMYENLERLLIVHACAEDPFKPSPIITVSNVQWCKAFLEALYENNKFFISNNVAASHFEMTKSKILRPIANAGSKGISHSKLLKNSHLKAKDMFEIIKTLEESNLIKVAEIKKRKLYFYIGK